MDLRKRGYLFKFASERVGTQKGGEFPQKRGDSNPGGNYDIFSNVIRL